MKHFFLDTNVVIDFLTNREPFSYDAANLFELSERAQIKIFVSAISFNNIYYLARQKKPHQDTIDSLQKLMAFCEVIDLTKTILAQAMNSEFGDLEDAIQYQSALGVEGIEAIVTRNQKDFKKSKLAVLSPKDVLHLIGSSL
jgi:predicted nucleic acid-binding protein